MTTQYTLWGDYFRLLMEFEGEVYECDPDDPGGATKYGIDQRSHPNVNIRSLTKKQAEAIYLAEYERSSASKLPTPFSFVYFDFVVNAGESAAVKALQRALGVVKVDGVFGPVTLRKTQELIRSGETDRLISNFSYQREVFYMNLAANRPSMRKYRSGWLRRAKTIKLWGLGRTVSS